MPESKAQDRKREKILGSSSSRMMIFSRPESQRGEQAEAKKSEMEQRREEGTWSTWTLAWSLPMMRVMVVLKKSLLLLAGGIM